MWQATHNQLKVMVGCLTHLSVVMQPVLHFLSCLRHLMECASHQQQVRVSPNVCEDARLFLRILDKTADGVHLDLVTFCMLTRFCRADSCPAGLGGYSSRGRAWRFPIPPRLQRHATINFLEPIVAKVGLRDHLVEGTLLRLSCICTMTDSTTARRWLHWSNFCEKDETKVWV